MVGTLRFEGLEFRVWGLSGLESTGLGFSVLGLGFDLGTFGPRV